MTVASRSWVSETIEAVQGEPYADELESTILALSFLADADGIVLISDIENHYDLAPGTLASVFPEVGGFRLSLPE